MLEVWSREIVDTGERILKTYPHLTKSERHEIEKIIRKYKL